MSGFGPVVMKSLSSAEAGGTGLGSALEVLSASQHSFQACGGRGMFAPESLGGDYQHMHLLDTFSSIS